MITFFRSQKLGALALVTLLVLQVFLFLHPQRAKADTVTWDGGGGDGIWSTGTNWSGDLAPGAGDVAVIDTAVTVQITGATTIGGLILGVSGGGTASILEFKYDAIDIDLSGGTADPLVVTNASGGTGDVTVYSGAKIQHTANTTVAQYTIYMDITGSMSLAGSINADALGCSTAAFSLGRGPHATTGLCTAGATGSGGNPGDGGGYGGEGGRSTSETSAGNTYGNSLTPQYLGSSGGSDGLAVGGTGGGAVQLDIDGALTLDGTISVDGGNGTTDGTAAVGTGGSGGSIYLTVAGAMNGSGSMSADGGAGGNGSTDDGGGGGGGRISVTYGSSGTFSFSSSVLAVTGGTAGAGGSAVDGTKGTVYTNNSGSSAVTIYHGFTYADTDHSVTTWTMDTSATNQYCASGILSPSVTAGTLTLAGTITCASTSLTSFNFDADTGSGSGLTVASGFTLNMASALNSADVDFDIPDGNTQTWTNVTITLPATQNGTVKEGGTFSVDDAVSLTLAGTTTISASISLTNLTAFSFADGTTLNASGYGCIAATSTNGSGPNGSNVCATTQASTGYGANGDGGGGAGHGGAGGAGDSGAAGGATYDSLTIPVLIGSSGGSDGTSGKGGNGGGLVRIDVAGDMTWNGAMTADGNAGSTDGTTQSGGGGSGGSVYVSLTGILSGTTGSVSVDGGDGGNGLTDSGGGGGGGRVRVGYGTDSTTFLSGLTAGGVAVAGTGPNTATDGSVGTLSTADIGAPTFVSSAYYDDTPDGTVDLIVLTFNEAVTVGGTVASTRFTWTSASGENGFAGSLSGNAVAVGSTIEITLASAEANETGHVTVPTIAYDDNTDDATNKITDAAGNLLQTFSAQNVSDAAAPLFVTAVTSNTQTPNVNGLNLVFSELVDIVDAGDGFDAITLVNETSGDCTIDNNGYDNSDVTSMSLNVTCSTTNNTALLFDPQYATAGDSTIIDNAGNEMTNAETVTSTDGAEPYPISVTYKDVTSVDGTVDRVDMVFSETLVGFAYDTTDWSFTVPSELTLDDTGASVTTTTSANDTIQLSVSADANETGHTTTPTLQYTNGNNRVKDANNATDTWNTAENVVDGAAPLVATKTYTSSGGNATVDRVVLGFTEVVTWNGSDLGQFGAGSEDLTNFGNTPSAVAGSGTSTLTLTVDATTNLTGVSGGTEPTITHIQSVTAENRVQDGAGNDLATFGATSLTDDADIVILSQTLIDQDPDGTIERVRFVFSENFAQTECESADYVLAGADSAGLSMGGCGGAGSQLDVTLSGTPENTTYLALTLAYDYDGGVDGSITDGSGNALQDTIASVITDGAQPIVTRTYTSSGGNGTVDRVVLNFTENMTWNGSDLNQFGVASQDLTSFGNTPSAVAGSGTSTLTLTVDATTNLTGVSGGTEPTITYAQSGTSGNRVKDEGGSDLTAFTTQSITDDADIVLTSLSYRDDDNSGNIERMRLIFSEAFVIDEVDQADYVFGGTDAGTIQVGGYGGAGNSVDYTLVNTPANTTFLDLTMAYDRDAGTSGSIHDASGNEMQDLSATAFTDEADPVLYQATFSDETSNDGKIDLVTILYTEDLSAVVDASGGFALTSAGNFASVVEGAVECNSGSAGTNACLYNFTTSTIKTDVGDLSLAYSGASSVVTDGANTAPSQTVTSASSPAFTDGTAPPAIDSLISIAGASGTAGAFKVGDTVTVTWDNSSTAGDVASVTANLTQFGGGASVTMTDTTACGGTATNNIYEACYTIVGDEAIDDTNNNVSVSATDASTNNREGSDTANATVDTIVPTVTAGSLTVTGDSGTAGAFKNGDAQTYIWNPTTSGEGDTIFTVTFNGSSFNADDTAVAGTLDTNWTVASTLGASQDDTGNTITATVTDNAGNSTTSDASTASYTIDTSIPVVTAGNISVTGASGTGGAFKFGDTAVPTWDVTTEGENDTLASVTFNADNFLTGDTALAGSLAGGLYTGTLSGALTSQDDTNNNITVTVIDDAGNTSGAVSGTNNYTIDTIAPTVTAGNVTVTGCTGTSGACKNGDTIVLNWLGDTDAETDTIASATFVATSFDTASTEVVGVDPGTPGTNNWTGSLTDGAMDAQDDASNQISVTVIDNAGNTSGSVISTVTYTIDTILPTLSTADFFDANTNGVVDRVDLVFSEDVSNGFTADKDEWTFPTPGTVTLTTPALDGDVTVSTTTVSLTPASSATNKTGGTSPTISYTNTAGTLQDDAGNGVADFTAQTVDDSAGAILVTTTPSSGSVFIPAVGDFYLTFSEPIATGSFSLSPSPALQSGSFVYEWDGTNETVTASTNGFNIGQVITHTITAPDASSNANVYVGSTYVITPLMPSSSGGGGGGGGASNVGATVTVISDQVTITSPNGGEVLTGGTQHDITWSSSGNINNINIYESIDGGVTYGLVASGTDNDGSYSWTVPNTATGQALVKIVGRDSGGGTLATDQSNATFTITLTASLPETTITTPTSGSTNVISGIPIVEVEQADGTTITLESGHLFRGVELSGVYLVDQDGYRRVFPSESVYFSYYHNFDDVIMVKDDQLRKLPIGPRVTMAPGRMIKIQSNPNVYQVHNGAILRLIPDEATARSLYGEFWNTFITDIAPTFWGDYHEGEPLLSVEN